MTNTELLFFIFLLAVGVVLTRFLPFLLFKNTEKLPKIVLYLGRVLPPAMMGLLVVYCVKDVSFTNPSELIPTVTAITAVVITHILKKNTILSIFVGTALYILLILYVFQ